MWKATNLRPAWASWKYSVSAPSYHWAGQHKWQPAKWDLVCRRVMPALVPPTTCCCPAPGPKQDMEPQEIGFVLRHPAAGALVAGCVENFPYLTMEAHVGFCVVEGPDSGGLCFHRLTGMASHCCLSRAVDCEAFTLAASGRLEADAPAVPCDACLGAASPYHPHRATDPAHHPGSVQVEGQVWTAVALALFSVTCC